MTTRSPSCPICKKPVATRMAGNPTYPFCSKRCRASDLGRWLGEEYRVPDAPSDEREDELPSEHHPERRGDA
jgi:hypothetical protein